MVREVVALTGAAQELPRMMGGAFSFSERPAFSHPVFLLSRLSRRNSVRFWDGETWDLRCSSSLALAIKLSKLLKKNALAIGPKGIGTQLYTSYYFIHSSNKTVIYPPPPFWTQLNGSQMFRVEQVIRFNKQKVHKIKTIIMNHHYYFHWCRKKSAIKKKKKM